MHELSVTKSIISIINTEAEKNGFRRVQEIKLCIGEFSDIIPRCLMECFPIAAEGTCAENAAVSIKTLPGCFECLDCGTRALSDSAAAQSSEPSDDCPAQPSDKKPVVARAASGMVCCPGCGSCSLRLVSGREFYVDSLKVE